MSILLKKQLSRLINKRPYQLVWFVLSIIGLSVAIDNYKINLDVVLNEKTVRGNVVDKYCITRVGRSSFIIVEWDKNEYKVEISASKKCEEIGKTLNVFYNRRYNYLFLRESVSMHKKYIVAMIISVLISIIPFKK
jgi:hypothetical protein